MLDRERFPITELLEHTTLDEVRDESRPETHNDLHTAFRRHKINRLQSECLKPLGIGTMSDKVTPVFPYRNNWST